MSAPESVAVDLYIAVYSDSDAARQADNVTKDKVDKDSAEQVKAAEN